jgi:hypothetical protein
MVDKGSGILLVPVIKSLGSGFASLQLLTTIFFKEVGFRVIRI